MEVEHAILNQEVNVKRDYSKDFHKSWLEYVEFEELLESEYMNNLIHYMEQQYSKSCITYPDKSDIFKSFKNVDFNDLRVVIFNESVVPNYRSNGNGFGEFTYTNHEIGPNNLTLRDVEKKIKSGYPEGSAFKFDRTLNMWNEQGVMVLNTSLISHANDTDNIERQLYFRNFIRNVITLIDSYLTDVIFVFTDDSQKETFGKYVSEYNYVLQTDGIHSDTTIFDDINQLLIENCRDSTELDEVVISW